MFCFCLSISVKNNTDVTIRPLKIKIGTASKAQPGAKKTSMVIRSKLVKVISLTNWLILLYSTKTKDITKAQAI